MPALGGDLATIATYNLRQDCAPQACGVSERGKRSLCLSLWPLLYKGPTCSFAGIASNQLCQCPRHGTGMEAASACLRISCPPRDEGAPVSLHPARSGWEPIHLCRRKWLLPPFMWGRFLMRNGAAQSLPKLVEHKSSWIPLLLLQIVLGSSISAELFSGSKSPRAAGPSFLLQDRALPWVRECRVFKRKAPLGQRVSIEPASIFGEGGGSKSCTSHKTLGQMNHGL